MIEKLREVEYSFENGNNEGLFDRDDSEHLYEKKIGLFHRWGDEMKWDSSEAQRFIPNTYAIVEDLETKNVYKINPECITFKR